MNEKILKSSPQNKEKLGISNHMNVASLSANNSRFSENNSRLFLQSQYILSQLMGKRLGKASCKKVIESLSGWIKKPFVYHKTQNSNKSWFIKIEYLKIIQIYTFKKQYLH